MLKLASDADMHGGIVRGLRRRRPDVDLIRARMLCLRERQTRTYCDGRPRRAAF